MKLFGTDGVRGKAGEFLTANMALRLAQAIGIYFNQKSKKQTKKILLGKDTRRSGYMIENALVSGLTSVGYDVIQIGPMPTPAVAYLTESMRCDAGIMLSASHNPFYDNGVKFFDCKGNKLSLEDEQNIQKIYEDEYLINSSFAIGQHIGKAKRIDDVIGRYIVSIKNSFPSDLTLEGKKIVLDCANGAAYKVAPTILEELGAELIVINNTPNGTNINEECGALYPEVASAAVLKHNADIGIALDGDADRVVIIDENGKQINGDKLIGALAVYLKQNNMLNQNSCVATVMSNLALDNYLKQHNIKCYRSQVGDKYVIQMLHEKNLNFGGEESGHIIFTDYAKTGDGLASALQVIAMVLRSKKKPSVVLNPFKLYPKSSKSINIKEKIPLNQIDGLEDILQEIKENGLRELVRYSGTENKIRLLIEGTDKNKIDKYMAKLEEFVKSKLC
jgi:phosphoglucosamine mutase